MSSRLGAVLAAAVLAFACHTPGSVEGSIDGEWRTCPDVVMDSGCFAVGTTAQADLSCILDAASDCTTPTKLRLAWHEGEPTVMYVQHVYVLPSEAAAGTCDVHLFTEFSADFDEWSTDEGPCRGLTRSTSPRCILGGTECPAE